MTQLQNKGVKIKIGGAFSSRNIPFQNLTTNCRRGCKNENWGCI